MPIRAVYPGTFDPPTYGHADIIRRAARLFGRLTVLVSENSDKNPVLSAEERVTCLERLIKEPLIEGAEVDVRSFSGLIVDYVMRNGICVIVRGLRAASDFDYENVIARTNRGLYGGIETVFIPSDGSVAHISSTVAREVAKHGGSLDELTPPFIAELLAKKYREGK